ncbi:MAG: VWA domain-containing protein [bacterium]
MITFLDPLWLLLAIPIGALWLIYRQPSSVLNGLRCALLMLLLLAASRPVLTIPQRGGTVMIVADRSKSMPTESPHFQKEAIDIIHKAMGKSDRLGIVSFARTSAIEHMPQQTHFTGFMHSVGKDQSNLSEGIEEALSLIPEGEPGRILLLSDGKWTGKNPLDVASRAAARSIPIDYRLMQRPEAHDVALMRFIAPRSVAPGESFMITSFVRSHLKQEIHYELLRGTHMIASGEKLIPSGVSRLLFRDRAPHAGASRYILSISGTHKDPVPENNRAQMIVGVKGQRPLLCVSSSAGSGLLHLLKAGGIEVEGKRPDECEWTLPELSNYCGLILENIPAEKIGIQGMNTIASWVEHAGGGLMITGGKNSYHLGGYFRSPLEPLMPVSLELRNEHRKMRVAIVVALDRSGSMAVNIEGGRTKMDLANIGTVQVLDLLSPQDEFGVIAVDSASHTVVDIDTVEKNSAYRSKILCIESMGGGIFIYEALSSACQMLLNSDIDTRHVILFADAADSEEPGDYKELLNKCEEANISVSVVGLGTMFDHDANLLIDIARRGEGQYFFTDSPEEIPRLFAQDTFSVVRNSFIEESSEIKATGELLTLTSSYFQDSFMIGGYNLCALHSEARTALISTDEYKAPICAFWFLGNGRVVCYTGEADGEFTGELAHSKKAGELFSSMARWCGGNDSQQPYNIMTSQNIERGMCRVKLHLDPERNVDPFIKIPSLIVIHDTRKGMPEVEKHPFKWESADTLIARIPLNGDETVLPVIDISKEKRLTLTPVCLPYSPEFEPALKNQGGEVLDELSKITQGENRFDLGGIWKTLPKKARLKEIAPWLLMAAIVIFLLEILHRRTGIFLLKRAGASVKSRDEERDHAQIPITKATIKNKNRVLHEKIKESSSRGTPESSPENEKDPMLEAMRHARKKARMRHPS